ncbi:MAG: DoxX family protein [Acidobacteriota bacterium]
MSQLTTNQTRISWVAQLAAAVIYLQTLFFKFTGAPESIYIFEQLGAEPWGRLASGVFELVVSVLLLVPATAAVGSVLSLGMISGAIVSHFTVLGIEVQGDGGTLFILACVVFIASAVVLFLRRRELPVVGDKL